MLSKNVQVYQRPTKTYTERLANEDIKEILKDYIIKNDNICALPHRYYLDIE